MNLNSVSCFILLIIVWEVLGHKNSTQKTHNKKHKTRMRQALRSNSKSFRRDKDDPLEKLQNKLGQFPHQGKDETFYDPYWQSGEWVFLRITTKKGDTLPSVTTLIPGVTQKKFRKWPMSIYRDCDILCLNIYKKFYGPVCGQRFNTMKWENEYQSFANMCELERENCKIPGKRPMWYPIHKEKFCDELTPFKLFPTNSSLILQQKTSWAPYEYLRTKTTATPGTIPGNNTGNV